MNRKPKLLVLVGPTAVGKTALSLQLAGDFGCEIISGDSMQVYRGMDIGTAKASPAERSVVPHHLIDIRNPDEPFSTADFQLEAGKCIADIHSRGKLPFIVGGTGLYIESLCYRYNFSEVGADEAYRKEQQQIAERHGSAMLHEKLAQLDPEAGGRIHPNDERRIIRALEVIHLTGVTPTEQLKAQDKQSPFHLCLIGLTMDRTLLYKRIEERIDLMMEQGLEHEVKRLLDAGFTADMVSMQGLGYKELIGYLHGQYGLDEAVVLLKRNTRRYAKRQLSWFRHMKDIHWVDVTDLSNFTAHYREINDIMTTTFLDFDQRL